MTDVTRPCVLTLRFERKFWKALKFPIVVIIAIIAWIVYYINWCVVRSVVRMVGVPIILYSGWCLNILLSKGKLIGIEPVLVVTHLFIMAGGCIFYIYVWANIPEKEQKILKGEEEKHEEELVKGNPDNK